MVGPRAGMSPGSSCASPRRPFSTVTIGDTGERVQVWTTFGTADWSEQVDLDLRSEATRRLIAGWFTFFASHGVRMVRLDAVGYVAKKAGTSCFMVEPEIWEAIDWLIAAAGRAGLEVLPEIHDRLRHARDARGARLLDVRLRPARAHPAGVRDR